jgi:hypothetical protein
VYLSSAVARIRGDEEEKGTNRKEIAGKDIKVSVGEDGVRNLVQSENGSV